VSQLRRRQVLVEVHLNDLVADTLLWVKDEEALPQVPYALDYWQHILAVEVLVISSNHAPHRQE
jgi:hypothetical protein